MKNKKHPSVMKHNFSQAPNVSVQRSVFERNHGHKTTFDSGLLVPIFVDEILPGDSVKLGASFLARLATPIYPVMDNMMLDSHFFFVPARLLWENWERFNGAQDNPTDSTDFLIPELPAPAGGFTAFSIADYFGLPTTVENINVNALPFRAYNMIYNEWYRDQNLQDSIPFPIDDGPDDPADYEIKRRGKRHDYFTSCLPWPQKGASVEIPIGELAPIQGLGVVDQTFSGTNLSVYEADGTNPSYAKYKNVNPSTASQQLAIEEDPANPGFPGIFADLSSATAATINQLRLAFQTQRLLERDARSGTRYVEFLKAHFGVTSPDFRLQRPEYLGGGSQPLNFNPIAVTADTTDSSAGDLSAYAISAGSRHGFSKSFVEHGYIIGLISARADLTYQTGIHRMWSRRTRLDFAFPVLGHLGEQSVLNKEIYAQGTADDENVFGFNERYAEYRYSLSKITGLFRSSHPQSLDAWHLSQDFDSLPALSDAFIQDDPPVDRVIRVQTEPHFIMDSHFHIRHARPLPVNSVPGMIDHF
ncbi:major capsid protein [Microviridae sp.]|nr:major capsid protein [Microviridae sp.]